MSKERVNKERLWSEFHKLRLSEDFISHWKQFMTQIKLKPYPLFFQHVTQKVFESIINKKFALALTASQNKPEEITRHTENEENALRYAAGYVLKEVKGKLKVPRDDNKVSIIKSLMQNDTQSESMAGTSTSESWVKAVDRGGLVKITDSAFQFFCAVEYALRRHLNIDNTENMDTKFQSRVVKSLVSDDDILSTGV